MAKSRSNSFVAAADPALREPRSRVQISFDSSNPDSVSRTKQQFAKEADINNIMAKYAATGVLVDPLVPRNRKPFYGDFSAMPNFLECEIGVAQARSEFERLPSRLRDRFDNDVVKLLDFLQDPANDAEAVSLGLKKAPPAVPVEEAPEAPEAPVGAIRSLSGRGPSSASSDKAVEGKPEATR